MKNSEKTTIIIDINDIRYNYQLFRKITKQGDLCIPVLKGNAYGFNYYDVAHNLLNMEEPQRSFFIYLVDEGRDLRAHFGNEIENIYCLTGPLKGQEEVFLRYNIIPVINSLEQLYIWSDFAKKKNEKLKMLIQFNLGLNRSGIQQNEIETVKNFIDDETNMLDLVMIMGHLGYQYRLNTELGQKFTTKEFELFENAYRHFPGIKRGLLGTEGILKIREGLFEFSRPGTALYTGQPDDEQENIFKTAITVTSSVFLVENTRNLLYVNFGLKHGLSTSYQNGGYVYVGGEKIFAKKVEEKRTLFEVEHGEKYEGKRALLLGYHNGNYIDGYEFSKLNGSVPEEVLCKVATVDGDDMIERVVLNGCSDKIRKPKDEIKCVNVAVYNRDGKLEKLTSTVTEIREILEDGGCGYDGEELVKRGDIIGTFPIGYADGLNRKISYAKMDVFVAIDNEIVSLPLCGKVPMDQMCFRIPKELKNKVKVGGEIIIIDNGRGVYVDRFCNKMHLTEEEIFFMIKKSVRIDKNYV
ncbi:MAG: alanine racemase [Rickettsiales bacterium]|jgi:alanine racemase|nr:alanine racemase [Rickettsiales bacterium]